MTLITSRIYEGQQDFQTMLDLMERVRPANQINSYPLKVDIEECLAVEEIRAATRLWFDGGQPVGWAYVDGFHNLLWEIENSCPDAVGAEMVAWGMDCIRRTLAAGESSTLDASCREDATERVGFLNRHGFCRAENFSIHMKRKLSDPIPDPQLPQGFIIRPLQGIEEAETVARTHRAAFDSDYMTTENRLIIMNSSEYDPSLDLVIAAPDGTIAAYCTCSTNPNGEGYTDPVATHPDYQGRGLSKALLLRGMQLLKERGMEFACLGTSGDNLAMQKSAQSVGFFLAQKTLWFEREVKN